MILLLFFIKQNSFEETTDSSQCLLRSCNLFNYLLYRPVCWQIYIVKGGCPGTDTSKTYHQNMFLTKSLINKKYKKT